MKAFILINFLLFISCIEFPDYDSKNCGKPSKHVKPQKEDQDETSRRFKRSNYFGLGDEETDDYEEDEEEGEEYSDDSIINKVMGGSDASIGELPWAVLLRIKQDDGSSGLCGGTLITRRHIVTAAHCFRKAEKGSHGALCSKSSMMPTDIVAERTEVTVGAVCQSLETEGCNDQMLGTKIKVKVVAHYTRFFDAKCIGGYDIALVELEKPIPTSLNHICLPHRHEFDFYNPKTAVMNSFGFGSDPMHGLKKTEMLQKVELGVPLEPAKCAKSWSPNIRGILCTKEEATKNVCTGDSGGGVTSNYNGREFLMGIISFGTDCDMLLQNTRANKAQMNTDIMYFTATIDKFTGVKLPKFS